MKLNEVIIHVWQGVDVGQIITNESVCLEIRKGKQTGYYNRSKDRLECDAGDCWFPCYELSSTFVQLKKTNILQKTCHKLLKCELCGQEIKD